ncbi:MAG: DegT/DnrJ/EryC1/StrS family aminotransferase [Pseudonocardia sp.]
MSTSTVLGGDEVAAYEAALADRLGVGEVVAVSSGTSALQTALYATGIRSGDEVLVPAVAVVMSASPITHLGATPVIVDCDNTGTDFDHEDLARKTTTKTAAVVPVHLWGRAGDTARLRHYAAEHDLAVIADSCQALGTTVDGVQVGAEATVACFSTHKLKLLSTDEGGFLTTNDPDIAATARAYRSHWLTPPAGQHPLSRLAHNFRLASPLAALGRRELARLDALLDQRMTQTRRLQRLLTGTELLVPLAAPSDQRWNHYAPLWRMRLPRPRELARHLAELGVPNSTGTFGLVPLDQRDLFVTVDTPSCTRAARFLDGILALVLTREDDEQRLREYAMTIAREVNRWASR